MAATIRISVIANCQAGPIGWRLLSIAENLEIVRIPPVHTIAAKDHARHIDELAKADVIIHQPIGETFGPLSTRSLQSNFSAKTLVSFPAIYFAGTIPQLAYLRIPGGGTLKGPLGDYHDRRIVSGFLNGNDPADVDAWLDDFVVTAERTLKRVA